MECDDRPPRAARRGRDESSARRPRRCGGKLRARIVAAAEGNPLFLEEMVALVREVGEREVAVPPTIQALLAARLDQLSPDERTVLEALALSRAACST